MFATACACCGFHRRCGAHSGARHWRQYGTVFRGQRCFAKPVAFSPAQSVGSAAREQAELRARFQLVPKFSGLATAEPHVLVHCNLSRLRFQPYWDGRTRAGERRVRFLTPQDNENSPQVIVIDDVFARKFFPTRIRSENASPCTAITIRLRSWGWSDT